MDTESAMENVRMQIEGMTAEDFAKTWNQYDADGNGFIEGSELRCFFKDLCMQKSSSQQALSRVMLDEVIKTYMEAFDADDDGRIGMAELADILNPEENFKAILQIKDVQRHRSEFTEIWKKYDHDGNGYIDAGELKSFLQDMIPQEVSEARLEKYASALLKMLDSNDDKRLEMQEMEKLFSFTD